MPPVPTPPVGAPAWLFGLFYVAIIVVLGFLFWKAIAVPKAQAAAKPGASAEALVVAGAFGSPNDVRLILECLRRVADLVDVQNRLLDENADEIKAAGRRVEQAIHDHRASDERAAERAAAALVRGADETRRLGDALAGVMSAINRGK